MEEEFVWGVLKVFEVNLPRARPAKREPGNGRASFARSCPYADLDTTKYAVAQVAGALKGKSAIHIARMYMGRKKNLTGQYFGT